MKKHQFDPNSPIAYLKHYKEELPKWLENYNSQDGLSFSDVMSGRTAYYPGCGNDGALITICSASHCCHSLIYVDYLYPTPEEFFENISQIHTYEIIGYHEWREEDVYPKGISEINVSYKLHGLVFSPENIRRFTVILQRKPNRDESWGVFRFALTFFSADAIESYFQLYVNNFHTNPFIMLLEDYGLGGNYDKFGKGGYLDAIMSTYGCNPPFALIGHASPWNDYVKLPLINSISGGMHRYQRYLYAHLPSFEDVKYINSL